MSRLASVSALLSAAAARAAGQPAVLAGGRSITFGELDDRAWRLAAGLRGLGLGQGARAALLVPPGIDFVALVFGLLRAGAVPVLIDPGIGWKNMGGCLAAAEPQAFIGSPLAHLARLAGGWLRGRRPVLVTVGGPRLWGGRGLADLLGRNPEAAAAAEPDPGDPAAVLFTSGSTGAPKGALYTHGIFAHQAAMLREHFGIAPGEFSVPTFPLFALFDVALGLSAVIPRMDATRPARVDPREILGPIREHKAVQLFGSPALLDAVGRYGEARGLKLPSLKRVISCGAPVPAKVLARVARMLTPGAEVHTPYGATEALPVSCIASQEILGETAALTAQGRGVCVGRPWPGMEVRIIAISDAPVPVWSEGLALPAGAVGEIVVKGPVVTREYFRRPDATALAKIADPDGGVRHRMGDLGSLDEQGRLWFCGRKSQRVDLLGETLFTVPCEAVFNEHPQVLRCALVGVQDRGRAAAVLCVELAGGADPETVRQELLSAGARRAQTHRIRRVLFHPGFPVDVRHNAKIRREELAVWAQKELS